MSPDWRKDYIRYKSFFLSMLSHYKERADLKAYLEMLLSLVTISVFTLFALRPTILTIATLMKEIEIKKQTLAVMDKKIENLARAQSLYEQERTKIVLLESAIPKNSQPDIFSRQIEGLVGAHHVAITSLTMDKGTILGEKAFSSDNTTSEKKASLPDGAQDTGFTITVTTAIDNYPEVATFLADFEKLRQPAVIDEVRLTRGQEKDRDDIVLFLKGRLPYLLYSRNIEVN